MSNTKNLLSYLESGNDISANEITRYFGLNDPRGAVRNLRNQGYCVYSNVKSDGTVRYRIGKPTKAMISAVYKTAGSSVYF